MEKSKKLKSFLIAIICLILMFLGILLCYNSKQVSFSSKSGQISEIKSDSEVGTMTIKYIDSSGKRIAPEETITGKIGDWYTTSRKQIASYKAYGDEPINKKGYYSDTDDVIEYVYEKTSSVKTTSIDENNQITIAVENEKSRSEYDLIVNGICSEKNQKLSGAMIKICKDTLQIKDGVTRNGEFYGGTITARDEGSSVYSIETEDTLIGYKSKLQENFNIIIKRTWNQEKSKFEITLEYDQGIDGVKVEQKDNQIIVTIDYDYKGGIPSKPEEPETPEKPNDPDNNDEVKEIDLGIEYFLNKINNEIVEGRAPEIKIESNQIKVIKGNKEKVSVQNNDKLNFIARVYNNSNFDGEIGFVKINIPKGLEFDLSNQINQENSWKMYIEYEDGFMQETNDTKKANVILSNKFINETLQKISNEVSYKDLEVGFIVSESSLVNSRDIENMARVITNEKDINEENNISSEYLYVKYFDLDITKYIEKIDVITDGKTTTKNIGIDSNEKLPKIEVHSKKINSTKLNITYGIKAKNIGEIAGLALEITDFIPDGFIFNETENPDWYLDGKVLKTTILNSEILNPGEEKILYLTLEWNLNENSLGEKTNQVKITNYYNESDSLDITEENISKSSVIVSISTGIAVYTGIVFIVSGIIVIGVLTLKKYGRKE